MHEKTNPEKVEKNIFNLTVQYLEKYSGAVQLASRGRHQVNRQEELLDGSGSLLDSILSTLLKKKFNDVWIVALFSHYRWHGSTSLHSEWLLQPLCSILPLSPGPQKLTMPPQIEITYMIGHTDLRSHL